MNKEIKTKVFNQKFKEKGFEINFIKNFFVNNNLVTNDDKVEFLDSTDYHLSDLALKKLGIKRTQKEVVKKVIKNESVKKTQTKKPKKLKEEPKKVNDK